MGVNLKALPDGSMGMEGKDLDNGAIVFVNIAYTSAGPLTMSGAVFSRSMSVQSVTVNPDVASTNAVTATAYQAASGTALGSGTALNTPAALNGTAGANVAAALSAASGALLVPAGSRVGVVISGALGAAGSGVITIGLTPR
ncbi:MAG TPA: hypothetical protein VIF60_24385 [Burkholderiaceae bacterium]|jgi:hypothetical protein